MNTGNCSQAQQFLFHEAKGEYGVQEFVTILLCKKYSIELTVNKEKKKMRQIYQNNFFKLLFVACQTGICFHISRHESQLNSAFLNIITNVKLCGVKLKFSFSKVRDSRIYINTMCGCTLLCC